LVLLEATQGRSATQARSAKDAEIARADRETPSRTSLARFASPDGAPALLSNTC
jgi:hypothetical protein